MFEANMDILAKRIAAVLLAISFFLPLAKCSAPVPPAGEVQEKVVEVTYAYSEYEWPSIEAFLAVLAFSWPLVFAILWPGKGRIRIRITEVMLCAGSGWLVFGLLWLRDLLIGGVVAVIALAVYAIATLYQLVAAVREAGTSNITNR